MPREAEQASQDIYGVSSLGFNLVPDGQGGYINLKEIEDNVEKTRERLDKLKAFWSDLKEYIKQQNIQIAEDSFNKTEQQVENWRTFKEKLTTTWQELKERFIQNSEERQRIEEQNIQDQIQAWEVFKTNVKQKWDDIKSTISERWNEIATNISEKWNEIKEKIATGWENLKIKFKEGVDNIKEWFNGIPAAMRNAINSLITWVETGINNIINKINNSGVMTLINRATGWGLAINSIYIPRLANGGIASSPTLAMIGEYSGASHNPEIVAPQSVMRETIDAANAELASVYAQIGRQIIQAIEQKELEVSIGDTTIAKSAARGNRQYQLATGVSLF